MKVLTKLEKFEPPPCAVWVPLHTLSIDMTRGNSNRQQRSPPRVLRSTSTRPDTTVGSDDDDRSRRQQDLAVADSQAAVTGERPTLKLRALSCIVWVLTLVLHVNIAGVVIMSVIGDGWLPRWLSAAVYLVAYVQAALYAVLIPLAASTTAQGWITFGHPAKVLGAANSSGPFDRGARIVGVRDYTRPADAGLPHARDVRIEASGGANLGAWHAVPCRSTGSVLEAVEGGLSVDDAFDNALRGAAASVSPTACIGSSVDDGSGAPIAALYLHGNMECAAGCIRDQSSGADALLYTFQCPAPPVRCPSRLIFTRPPRRARTRRQVTREMGRRRAHTRAHLPL